MARPPNDGPLAGPAKDCGRCERLTAFRAANRKTFPDWFNGAVPAFGPGDAALLVVGLAPGLRGANRTGRPFTGDYAGDVLYPALIKAGLARGTYGEEADDGLVLVNCRITNAVRCVPPENKPTIQEQKSCRDFLVAEIAAMPRLRSIMALGRVAHDAVLGALGARKSHFPFAHGTVYGFGAKLSLTNCYHCSRYNLNTGVLTEAMFESALAKAIKAAHAAA